MRYIILSVSGVFLLWFSGLITYICWAESYSTANRTATNAITVITGGRQRLETSISLLKVGYAPVLFIAGVESQSQLKNFLAEQGVKQQQIIYAPAIIANNSIGFQDGTREIADFVVSRNLSSIRLVTSSYNMPVALEEIRELIPAADDIYIIPHPISTEQRQYSLLLKSYHQYLLMIIKRLLV